MTIKEKEVFQMMDKRNREEVRQDIIKALRRSAKGTRLRYLPCERMEGLSILEEMEAQGLVERIDIRHPEQMEWYYLWKMKNGG